MSNFWIHAKKSMARFGMALALAGSSISSHAQQDFEEVLSQYLADGLHSNLELKRQGFDLQAALAKLDEARALRSPKVELSARFTRNEGGRVTDIPVGQLVNPAYAAIERLLNAQGQTGNFPTISDSQIQFLRPREQDTRISASAPLYAPAIPAAIRAQEAQLSSETYARVALARRLVRDITHAYLNWLKAREAVSIVESSEALLAENLRVNQALVDAGKVTRDRTLRAQAELLSVRQLKREAENQQTKAQNYFNFLLNRELESPIFVAKPQLAPSFDRVTGLGGRAELASLDQQVGALDALIDVARAEFKPRVSVALDAGIQGEKYEFGGGNNFASLSLVMSFTVFDGGARQARLAQASLAREAAATRRDELQMSIALEVKSARDDLSAAYDSLATASAREEAAAAAFLIARRKRDAGVLPQIEFIDARNALTEAELNGNLTRFDYLARRANLDYASANRALPATFLSQFP